MDKSKLTTEQWARQAAEREYQRATHHNGEDLHDALCEASEHLDSGDILECWRALWTYWDDAGKHHSAHYCSLMIMQLLPE